MQGFLELEPTQIPMRATISLDKFVEVRIEPQLKELPIYSDKNTRGSGGGKKRKQIGTELQPTGLTNVQVSTTIQGYSLSFNNSQHAAAMYAGIREALLAGGGVARDITPEEQSAAGLAEHVEKTITDKAEAAELETADALVAMAERTETSPEEETVDDLLDPADDASAEPATPVGIADAAIAEVEAEGYEADPPIVTNYYACSKCQCEYKFETTDVEFAIACPECETSNSPVRYTYESDEPITTDLLA